MTWSYRLLDHGTHFAVHEVFYDRRGRARSWTKLPVEFVGNTVEELCEALTRALHDVRSRPVLDAGTGVEKPTGE